MRKTRKKEIFNIEENKQKAYSENSTSTSPYYTDRQLLVPVYLHAESIAFSFSRINFHDLAKRETESAYLQYLSKCFTDLPENGTNQV